MRAPHRETIYHPTVPGPYCDLIAVLEPNVIRGQPRCIHLQCGCNELWLEADEAAALLVYLRRTVPKLKSRKRKK